jgi:hypothetical protein
MTKNEVLEKLKTAVSLCHPEKFGKRVETSLQKSMTGVTVAVYASKESFRSSSIRVWYDVPGEGRAFVEISFYLGENGETWQEKVLRNIEQQFSYDSDERAEQEAALIPELTRLNAEITRLQGEALRLIESLPVPVSTTLRKDPSLWSSPSWELTKKFPQLFK